MKHDEPEIIARRQLERDGRAYEVLIERPHRQGPNDDFVCRWSLVDGTGSVVLSRQMFGVDSVGALTYTLLIIGLRLGPGFTLPGGKDSGFPRYEPSETPGKFGSWRLGEDDSPGSEPQCSQQEDSGSRVITP